MIKHTPKFNLAMMLSLIAIIAEALWIIRAALTRTVQFDSVWGRNAYSGRLPFYQSYFHSLIGVNYNPFDSKVTYYDYIFPVFRFLLLIAVGPIFLCISLRQQKSNSNKANTE